LGISWTSQHPQRPQHFEYGRVLPFKSDTLIEEIGGKGIKNCSNIHAAPDGELAGRVQLSDGRWVPFKGDVLIEEIGGKEVADCFGIHSTPDGELLGKVALEGSQYVSLFFARHFVSASA